MSIYESLLNEMKKEIPGFHAGYKSDSELQRIIGKVLFFNPKYMSSFTTTLYPNVYYPESMKIASDTMKFNVMSHEFVHLYDAKPNVIRFSLLYLMPQALSVLSVLSVLSLVHPMFMAFMLFLIFALPIPSCWRRHYEMRGYSMNMMIEFYKNGYISKETKEFISSQFTGWNYYKMWTNSDEVKLDILRAEADIRSGRILQGEAGKPFKIVADLMIKYGEKRV